MLKKGGFEGGLLCADAIWRILHDLQGEKIYVTQEAQSVVCALLFLRNSHKTSTLHVCWCQFASRSKYLPTWQQIIGLLILIYRPWQIELSRSSSAELYIAAA